MLDVEATRRNFEAWVRSAEFDEHFNSICKPPLWSFIFGGIFILTGIGIPLGIGLLIYGFVARSRRKAARRDVHLAFSHHQPILCGIVIANRQLFQHPGAVAPALLVGGFGALDFDHAETLADAAMLLGGLYGENPAEVPDPLKAAFAAVNDDTYRPNRRRNVPLPLESASSLLLFDAVLKGSHFDSSNIDSPTFSAWRHRDRRGTFSIFPISSPFSILRASSSDSSVTPHPPSRPPSSLPIPITLKQSKNISPTISGNPPPFITN
jgi:hypothetical protein